MVVNVSKSHHESMTFFFTHPPHVSQSSFENKTIIIPSRSSTLVECFAIDWLIVNMNLERVGIFTAPDLVDCIIQVNAYTEDVDSELTTGMELFSNQECDFFVIQIRGDVEHKNLLAKELLKFITANKFGKTIVMTGSDSCFLTGQDLGEKTVELTNDCTHIVNGGFAKKIARGGDNSQLIVSYMRGYGMHEIHDKSKEMAKLCCKLVGVSKGISQMPPSLKTLV